MRTPFPDIGAVIPTPRRRIGSTVSAGQTATGHECETYGRRAVDG
jgi:hypothetical protein